VLSPLVEIEAVHKTFDAGHGRSPVLAIDGVTLHVESGVTVALVGESGSGKTTLGRVILGLTRPTAGYVRVGGHDVNAREREVRRLARKNVQVVFQNPSTSLNPTMSVARIVCEPIREPHRLRGKAMRVRAAELLETVELEEKYLFRRPHELSGGEQQRVAIARSLAADPKLIVLDEPTASLDFAIRRHILALLRELQEREGLTYFYITHDLLSARYLAPVTAVLYAGRVVEIGATRAIVGNPRHPYTRLLTASAGYDAHSNIPFAIRENDLFSGGQQDWQGCAFRGRCGIATERCAEETPELRDIEPGGHGVRCHHAENVLTAIERAQP
jgi:oligopeptide/dipeptide ABC transporter ATP-binding protein